MNLKEIIKSNKTLKKLAIFLMFPRNQARPRLWVKWFINPFKHHKGKHALIRRRTRIDVLPTKDFYLGDDSTIEDFSTINNGVGDVYIGNRTRIGISCTIIGPVQIGDDVRLAQNIVMSGLNHNYENINLPISEQGVNTSKIIVEDEAWIGANVFIAAGVTIGKHSIVAGGAVVTKNVPAYSIVAGNPGRVIKKYDSNLDQWIKVK